MKDNNYSKKQFVLSVLNLNSDQESIRMDQWELSREEIEENEALLATSAGDPGEYHAIIILKLYFLIKNVAIQLAHREKITCDLFLFIYLMPHS